MIKINENSRIFVCGDTHGEHNISKLNIDNWPEQKVLTENDFLIQAGDFGFIWKNEPDRTEQYWLNWFDCKENYTLFIGGNHENHKRLNEYPVIDFYGGKASMISPKVIHLKNGYVYNFGGKTFWLFGGGLSIDKEWRVEGKSWWPEEIPDYKTMQMGMDNLEAVGYKVDYIITHTMPRECINMFKEFQTFTEKYNDPVANYLDEILRRMLWGYDRWYAGHFHEDKNIEHYKLTIMMNKVIEIGKNNEIS